MPDYKKNSDRNKMVPYELPSTPGATLHLPSKLGYGNRIRVRSAAYKVHVEQDHEGQDRVFQTVDPAAAERELLIQSLLDSKTYHNLTDNGRPIQLTRYWIENEMDEDDALYLGAVLMNDMQEEIGVPEEEDGGPKPMSNEPTPSGVEAEKNSKTVSGTPSPESGFLTSEHQGNSVKDKSKTSKEKTSSEHMQEANK